MEASISMAIISLIFIFAAVKTRKEHMPLQIFFFIVGMISVVNTISIMRTTSETGGESSTTLGLIDAQNVMANYGLWFIVAYTAIYLILMFLFGIFRRHPVQSFFGEE